MADPSFTVFAPDDQKCGEGCGRKAVVEVGDLTYCVVCLGRLLRYGDVFRNAMDQLPASDTRETR